MLHKCISWILKSLTYTMILCFSAMPLLLVSIFARFRQNRSVRTFIGIQEIASNIHSIQKTLDIFGYSTTSLVLTNTFSGKDQFGSLSERGKRVYLEIDYSSKLTRIWSVLQLKCNLALRFFLYFKAHDVWFFVWRETFLPLNFDLLFLRLAGKKIIMMHCGDDVRYRPLQRAIDKKYKLDTWVEEQASIWIFLRKFLFVRMSEVFADFIISHRDLATFQQIPYFFFHFPMFEVSRETSDEPSDNANAIRIVHAPSCRKIKRTDIVLESISILKDRGYPIEFVLLEKQPNSTVIRELAKADILIDQPATWAARFAIEGCAARCAVIGGNYSEYIGKFDSPILQFPHSATELSELVILLLDNPRLLMSKKDECYRFWSENYSPDSFHRFYKGIFDRKSALFYPVPAQREILLQSTSSWAEWIILYFFYRPRNVSSP